MEHFIVAIDDPELELKVREKEPQNLDAAVMYAQRLETFKYSVRQRHQRYVRKVSASPDSRPSSSAERITKGDCGEQKFQHHRDESFKRSRSDTRQSNKYNRKEEKEGDKRVCVMAVDKDEKWKEEMLKEVRDLKLNQEKMAAENSALNKEVERLRNLEQLRYVPAPASTSAAAPVVKPLLSPGSASQQRDCFACNSPGHMAKNCPQNSATHRADNHTRQTYGPNESLDRNQEPYLCVTIDNQMYDCLLDSGHRIASQSLPWKNRWIRRCRVDKQDLESSQWVRHTHPW